MSKEKKDVVKYEEKYGAFSSIKFFPRKDQILVLPLYVAPVKKSDIILPESITGAQKDKLQTYDKYPYQAIVVAVGPGFTKDNPVGVKPGMRVYMNQPFSGQNANMFLWNKINYYKCQEGNILGIADDDTDDPRKELYANPVTEPEVEKKNIN